AEGGQSIIEAIQKGKSTRDLLGDDGMMAAMTEMFREDRGGYERVLAVAREKKLLVAGIKKTVEDRLKKEAKQQQHTGANPPNHQHPYLEDHGCICRRVRIKDCEFTEPLCNFSAIIKEEVTRDDGAETQRRLAIEGKLHSG